MKAEEFEQEWKRYCDSKGGGAVTMNVKDVAKHFADWQKKQMMKDSVEGKMELNHIVVSYAELAKSFPTGKDGDKVKVIIIKE